MENAQQLLPMRSRIQRLHDVDHVAHPAKMIQRLHHLLDRAVHQKNKLPDLQMVANPPADVGGVAVLVGEEHDVGRREVGGGGLCGTTISKNHRIHVRIIGRRGFGFFGGRGKLVLGEILQEDGSWNEFVSGTILLQEKSCRSDDDCQTDEWSR